MRRDGGLVGSAPGDDQHRVQPARHQAREHTLVARLDHRLVLVEEVVVLDDHLVGVEVSGRVPPVHLQVVVPRVVGGGGVLDARRLCSGRVRGRRSEVRERERGRERARARAREREREREREI